MRAESFRCQVKLSGAVWSNPSGLLAVQNFVLHKKAVQQESPSYSVLIDSAVCVSLLCFPQRSLNAAGDKRKGLIFHHSKKIFFLQFWFNMRIRKKSQADFEIAQNIKINHRGEKNEALIRCCTSLVLSLSHCARESPGWVLSYRRLAFVLLSLSITWQPWGEMKFSSET